MVSNTLDHRNRNSFLVFQISIDGASHLLSKHFGIHEIAEGIHKSPLSLSYQPFALSSLPFAISDKTPFYLLSPTLFQEENILWSSFPLWLRE